MIAVSFLKVLNTGEDGVLDLLLLFGDFLVKFRIQALECWDVILLGVLRAAC